uniref:LAM_G_DOMAIN domain-containing protein n=1 Tax=Steinernema glaseri TaxID=37863 RepID=A0A1I7YLF6_9BILA
MPQGLYKQSRAYRSCRDHYLQGAFRDGAYALQGDESFLVNCEFPKESGGLVTTVVESALAKWHLVTANQTVGYQIRDRELLEDLVDESDSCEQTLYIQWQGLEHETSFSIESISGTQRFFETSLVHKQLAANLVGLEAGVLHLFPDDSPHANQSAFIRASPLRCSQHVLDQTCLFTFNKEDSDGLTVSFFQNLTSLEFSFRSDRPTMPFLRVRLASKQIVNIDLIDGYLLTVNHLIHPIKLLSDGHWHRFRLLYPQMDVYIDDAKTAIKITSDSEAKIDSVDVALSGEVTELLLNGDRLICADDNTTRTSHLADISYKLTPNLILDICPAYEDNFCNCKAPNSAIVGDPYAKAQCRKGSLEEGYHLTRDPRAISFFYTENYQTYDTVSVLFKTYADTGLLLFGASGADPFIGGVVRTQVYFKNNVMTAVICHPKSDGSEKCRACSILEPKGFRTSDWNRVSLFHYKDYHYLTVNENICQLTPEEGFSFLIEIYKLNKPLKEQSALFVGGTLYAKNSGPWEAATREFKDHFWEHTREKPQSLEGCIGEIRVGGVKLNLDDLFEKQLYSIMTEPKREAFSMKKGCISCSASHIDCHGTACLPSPSVFSKSKQYTPTCACEDLYTVTDPTTGSCRQAHNAAGDQLLSPAILLSSLDPNPVSVTGLPINRRATMYRFWTILTFPSGAKELQALVDFNSLVISVGDYGRAVVVEIDGVIQERFNVDPSDERAHLISIKRRATVGTGFRWVTVQLDNDVRHIQNDEFFDLLGDKITIHPVAGTPGAETRPGCIMDMGVAYEFNEPSAYRENQQFQIDWKEYILYQLHNSGSDYYKSLVSLSECGVRDPSLWTSGTEPFGIVGDYDPKGVAWTSPLGTKNSWWWMIAAAVAIFFSLMLCFCCLFCLCSRSTRKTHGRKSPKAQTNGKLVENGYHSDRSTFLDTPEPSRDYLLTESPRIEAPKSPSGTSKASKAPLVRPEDV